MTWSENCLQFSFKFTSGQVLERINSDCIVYEKLVRVSIDGHHLEQHKDIAMVIATYRKKSLEVFYIRYELMLKQILHHYSNY